MIIGERQHARFQIARGSNQERLVISAKNLQTEERHGSVSFFLENYFSSASQDIVLNRVYRNWVTLFDHPDDDVYDGIIGEDDDELPRVLLEIIVEEVQTPKRDTTPQKGKQAVEEATKQVAKQPVKTTTAATGHSKTSMRPTSGRAPMQPVSQANRPKSSASTPSLAGGKSSASVAEYNARKEREAHLANIEEEIKKYDIEGFKQDTLHKVLTNANTLAKTERLLAQDEKKNLRYLDRALNMQRTL